MKNISCLLGILMLLACSVLGQRGDTLSLQKYKQAEQLLWKNISKYTYHLSVSPHWKKDNTGFWYEANTEVGLRYMHLDYANMEPKEIFDHNKLSKKLNENYELNTDVKNLGLRNLTFVENNKITFSVGGKEFSYDSNKNILEQLEAEIPASPRESISPDGNWIAYVQEYNLHIKRIDGSDEKQLSYKGKKNYEYASRYGWFDKMEGEGGKRPERFSLTWFPDSKKIYCNIVDLTNASKMYMLDNSIDTLYRPKLWSYYRASPGDTNIVYYQPVIFDLESNKEIKINVNPIPHFMGGYPTWSKDGEKMYFTYWKRGFQKVSINEVDLVTGDLKELYKEESNIGIELSSFVPYFSEQNDVFIFTSEKSGWKQLYKLDLSNNSVSPITEGDYFIDEVEHIDEKKQLIYFAAAGKDPNRNPYHNYLYRVDFDGESLVQLTKEAGSHDVSISPDGKYFVDNASASDQPTNSILRDTELGNVKSFLSKTNSNYLDSLGWESPQEFVVQAGDGVTDIYGVIYKPTDFKANKSYPVIDVSYTGPHTSVYPKSFYSTIRSSAIALAELGFVLIRVDGRGSNHRSKAFRAYSYKNLGRGLDDHITAIKTLAKEYSWIDASRVGIFGHSAGGYDAGRALLAYEDFYKVGVASSADHDHRMEKAWWPEMYMGWPVEEQYEEQSNVTNAKNLKGKLLLVHGSLDDNVNISATMKLSEALIKADKEFDQLIIPSQRHGYSRKYAEYFAKKRWNYFVEHLLGKVPRWEW